MSHRLQVLLEEDEFAEIRSAARRRRMTVSEYVRRTLREARTGEPATSAERKLLVVREAAEFSYPTADPEAMEAEIARGYAEGG
ncbi:MAG: antitoxin [Gemmatimonadota bacterium]|jgi:hypothetical protein